MTTKTDDQTTLLRMKRGTPAMRTRVLAVALIAAASTVAACAPPPPSSLPGNVERVIDGDTIVMVGGERVRLIGIDAPEPGQCGSADATSLLIARLAGQQVQISAGARTDRDAYGRLLRYVDINGFDVQLELLNAGFAIARYDSRDGYGHHPRQETYVAADAAHPNVCR